MKRPLTADQRSRIVDLLRSGHDRATIAALVGVAEAQVSAVSAHLTMGTYQDSASTKAESIAILEMPARRAAPSNSLRGIPVGLNDKDQLVCWNFEGTDALPNPHLLILGETGSGKSYAISCLLGELKRQNKSSIIFDYAQGFSHRQSIPGFQTAVQPRTIHLSLKGIAINPLEILAFDLHGPLSVSQRVADAFARVYPRIGVQQHALLRDTILELFSDLGIRSSQRASWSKEPPAFSHIAKKLGEIAERRSGIRRIAESLSAHISTLFVFDLLRRDGESVNWADMVNREANCYVLSLYGLDNLTSRIVSEFLLWNLISFAEAKGPSPIQVFIVLDEAHRFAYSSGSPIERLLREGRKFGLGAVLASQQPEDFTALAFGNTAAKLIFQISDHASLVSRQLFRKTLNGPSFSQIYETLPRLPRGFAFAIFGNQATVLRILTHEERSKKRRTLEL